MVATVSIDNMKLKIQLMVRDRNYNIKFNETKLQYS
jgi:hypothetical protein